MPRLPDQTTETLETQDFVIFRLDDEYFAFNIRDVAEVFPYSEPVRIPRAPKFLVGLVDVRGVMLPVVDLRLRAELKQEAPPRHIIAVRLADRFIGAAVDEVREVYAADERDRATSFARGSHRSAYGAAPCEGPANRARDGSAKSSPRTNPAAQTAALATTRRERKAEVERYRQSEPSALVFFSNCALIPGDDPKRVSEFNFSLLNRRKHKLKLEL